MSKISMYEELTFNAHPALYTQLYDGWVLRYANGYTKKANSISPLYPSVLDLNKKIADCEERYFAQGLPCIFRLTEESGPRLDSALDKRGYVVADLSYVMEMSLPDKDYDVSDCLMSDNPDSAWMDAYYSLYRYGAGVKKDTAKLIFESIKSPVICGRLIKEGSVVACGIVVIERGYAGLMNAVVQEDHRNKGYGQALCEALLYEAGKAGAYRTYLQLLSDNTAALSLFTKIGYDTAYKYWYRLKQADI